jgi:hypothetical protein
MGFEVEPMTFARHKGDQTKSFCTTVLFYIITELGSLIWLQTCTSSVDRVAICYSTD